VGDNLTRDLRGAFDLSDMYGKTGLCHTWWVGGLYWERLHRFSWWGHSDHAEKHSPRLENDLIFKDASCMAGSSERMLPSSSKRFQHPQIGQRKFRKSLGRGEIAFWQKKQTTLLCRWKRTGIVQTWTTAKALLAPLCNTCLIPVPPHLQVEAKLFFNLPTSPLRSLSGLSATI
jgi:hypothetical protein